MKPEMVQKGSMLAHVGSLWDHFEAGGAPWASLGGLGGQGGEKERRSEELPPQSPPKMEPKMDQNPPKTYFVVFFLVFWGSFSRVGFGSEKGIQKGGSKP